jgi:ribonuclease HII
MPRSIARRTIENAVRRLGFARVAGVDEVGRGSLAGPLVVAAVILDPDHAIFGLRDSKLLSAPARGRLHDEILRRASAWTLTVAEPFEIDRLNVHKATLKAMRSAVTTLVPLPDFVLVDGFRIPDLMIPQRPVIQGDRRCAAIAAASIIAKVTRDRHMTDLHEQDPRYGFDQHKGYGTKAHLSAMKKFGYSRVHRQSFRPASLFK